MTAVVIIVFFGRVFFGGKFVINCCVFVVVSLLPNMFWMHNGFVNVALLITGFDSTLNECAVRYNL